VQLIYTNRIDLEDNSIPNAILRELKPRGCSGPGGKHPSARSAGAWTRGAASIPAVSSILKAPEDGADAALAEAERALVVRPEGHLRGFALWERAVALERLERWPQALDAFEELFAAQASSPSTSRAAGQAGSAA
jgi:hypothetical protein